MEQKEVSELSSKIVLQVGKDGARLVRKVLGHPDETICTASNPQELFDKSRRIHGTAK